jgi:hypothetical protein
LKIYVIDKYYPYCESSINATGTYGIYNEYSEKDTIIDGTHGSIGTCLSIKAPMECIKTNKSSLIVNEWKARGFHWGHYMERKADDHHFQKAALGAKPSYSFKSESAAADNDISTATDYDTVKPSKPVKKANTAEKAQKKPTYNYKGLTDEVIAEKERLSEAKERILERTRRHRKSADSILGKAWSRK